MCESQSEADSHFDRRKAVNKRSLSLVIVNITLNPAIVTFTLDELQSITAN